jgi:hypothetical protein
MVSLRHASPHLTRAIARRHASKLTLPVLCRRECTSDGLCRAFPLNLGVIGKIANPIPVASTRSDQDAVKQRCAVSLILRLKLHAQLGIQISHEEYARATKSSSTRYVSPPDWLCGEPPDGAEDPSAPAMRQSAKHDRIFRSPGIRISHNAPLKMVHRLYTLLGHGNQPI